MAEWTFVVANIKIQEVAPIVDRSADLEAEIAELQAEVRRLSDRLTEERAHRGVLQRAVGYATARARALDAERESASIDENMYVFDDEDESRAAFDRFFAAPDPHLDKVRGFLLD